MKMNWEVVRIDEGDPTEVRIGTPEPEPPTVQVVVMPSLHPLMQTVVTMFAHRGTR